MALALVLTADTPAYRKGTILTNQTAIDEIRTSEYALMAVQVSDTVIPPPAPPPPPPDLSSILAAVQGVTVKNTQQDAALSAAQQVNVQQEAVIAGQNTVIAEQDARISELDAALSGANSLIASQLAAMEALVARVEALENEQPPPPPANIYDDLPLSDDEGIVLTTNSGKRIAADMPE